jgi:peptidoglycan L-alanyl-D-glutamate endopeptidase CwlK
MKAKDFPRPSDQVKLASLDMRLQHVLLEALSVVRFTLIWGFRGEGDQNAAYNDVPPRSFQKWPDSKHNKLPSLAVDVAPFPGLYSRPPQDFYFLAGIIKGVGAQLGIPLVSGCDWDGDGETQDQRFHDLGHIELKDITV